MATWATTGRGHVVTQGDAAFAAPRTVTARCRSGRNWAVAESRAEHPRDDRSSWQERMGLTVEEALQLPALAGTSVAAGAAGLGRVVRHMVVDDPSDPLAGAGADVLVVLGARLPRPTPPTAGPWSSGWTPMGTAALAFRRTEGPAPVPGEVLAEADRGVCRSWRSPPACAWTRSCPRCSAPSSTSRARRWRCPPAWTTSSSGWRSAAAGWPRSPTGWP